MGDRILAATTYTLSSNSILLLWAMATINLPVDGSSSFFTKLVNYGVVLLLINGVSFTAGTSSSITFKRLFLFISVAPLQT